MADKIVRLPVAFEACGSCTCIALGKMGKLTANQLAALRILLSGR